MSKTLIALVSLAALLSWAGEGGASIAPSGGPGFSMGVTEGKSGICMDCHRHENRVGKRYVIDEVAYLQTNHARIGCPSCHETVGAAHPQVKSGAPKSDCRECHGDIAAEYASTLHSANVACGGCHDPHRAMTGSEILGQEVKLMCARCHDTNRITASHAKWLPQADLHIAALPCTTCHTGSGYVITLYIVERGKERDPGAFRAARYDDLSRLSHGKDILQLVDANGDQYVSLTELKKFAAHPVSEKLRLEGMFTPASVSHDFRIAENRWDCTFCHVSGPDVMQTSVLAIPEKNGTFRKVEVERGAVLSSLYGAPDFYLTGAGRNTMLNKVGLLIIAGGLVMPVGHGFLRFLTRKNRMNKEDES